MTGNSLRAARRAAVIFVMAACGDSAGPDTGIAGTYALERVDAKSLPAVLFQHGSDVLEVLSGSMKLDADGTFESSLTRRETVDGSAMTSTLTQSGTFKRSGASVMFRYGGGVVDAGTVDGSTLIINSAGFLFEFRR